MSREAVEVETIGSWKSCWWRWSVEERRSREKRLVKTLKKKLWQEKSEANKSKPQNLQKMNSQNPVTSHHCTLHSHSNDARLSVVEGLDNDDVSWSFAMKSFLSEDAIFLSLFFFSVNFAHFTKVVVTFDIWWEIGQLNMFNTKKKTKICTHTHTYSQALRKTW